MMSKITITNPYLNVSIDSLGAQLASIKDQAGIEYLWQGDERIWKNRAPVLFPIVGSLKNNQYTLHGQAYSLPLHGFACRQEFSPGMVSDSEVIFKLTGNPEIMELYPFSFVLRVGFKLVNNSLLIRYEIDNPASEILYASIGAHEGYACPEGIEAYQIAFEQAETLNRCLNEGALLSNQTSAVLENSHILPLHDGLFSSGALVFASLRSQEVTLGNRTGSRRIRVEFPGFPSLGIWTKPGAPFVCIEPWCGLPDFIDHSGEISRKRGILSIAPRHQLVRTHKITIN